MNFGFKSERAEIKTRYVSAYSMILGPTLIGENTIIDFNVVVGYPSRRSLSKNLGRGLDYIELMDKSSSGAKIGKNCHIRSGTVIYENVKIGDNVQVGHNVLIRENTVIGDNVVVGTLTVIEGNVKIGNNVRMETGVFIPINTNIHDNVFLAPYVVITNDKYPLSNRLIGATIEEGAIIGANTILIPGVKIGKNAVVAAGSIVTKDVPPNTVVAGTPARKISTREIYEKKKRDWVLGQI